MNALLSDWAAAQFALQRSAGQAASWIFCPEVLVKTALSDRDLEIARQAVNTSPTPAQQDAGNYAKGHIAWKGLEISIENPKGSTRSGVSRTGKKWSSQMHADYGYFKGTQGKDKDHLDVFIGPTLDSEHITVINQVDPTTGELDEHKIVIGCSSEKEARELYLKNYSAGWRGLGSAVSVTLRQLKDWIANGDTTETFAGATLKAASSDTLAQLKAAKAASDQGNYPEKHRILRELYQAAPQDFLVDSRYGRILGITHTPTQFRLHVPANVLPEMEKAADALNSILDARNPGGTAVPGESFYLNSLQHTPIRYNQQMNPLENLLNHWTRVQQGAQTQIQHGISDRNMASALRGDNGMAQALASLQGQPPVINHPLDRLLTGNHPLTRGL